MANTSRKSGSKKRAGAGRKSSASKTRASRAKSGARASSSRAGAVRAGAASAAVPSSKVEILQDELIDLGYMTAEQKASGPGLFGPQTQSALRAFQQDNHLTVNGTFDAETEEAFLRLNEGIKRDVTGPVTSKIVRGLQDRLVALRFLTPQHVATGPGKFGPLTEEALKSFQRQHSIEPSGVLTDETYKVLRTAVPATPPSPSFGGATAINTVLPESGIGFTTFNREHAGADQFGRASTIQAIIELGQAWAQQRPTNPFAVGDISRNGGGPFPPHKSHKDGRDADIRPLTKDGVSRPTTFRDANYSRPLTRELIVLLRQKFPGALVLFNDPQLITAGLCRSSPGHDNHLHFRFP